MSKTILVSVLGVLLAGAAAAAPQQTATPAATTTAAAADAQQTPDGGVPSYIKPETPEERRLRLGTPDDPGIDPDPNKKFWRFGRPFHISKYERRLAAYDEAIA